MTDLAPADPPVLGPGQPRTKTTRSDHVSGGPGHAKGDQNAGVPGRAGLLSLGAAVGLAMMTAVSTGDALAAGVLLGLAAADLIAGTVGVLVGIAVIGRWGSSSLAALAGGQAVFGAAGWRGPPGMVVSSSAAAAAVLLVCPRVPRPSTSRPAMPFVGVVACGIFAAALVAGPATGGNAASVIALRVMTSLLGVVLAAVIARVCPRRIAHGAGVVAAVAAAALAVLA